LGFDKIVVRVNDAGNLNLYVTDATQQNLLTWGGNGSGGVGDNTIITRSTPVTTFTGGTNWKSVACGLDHTAAIKTDGSLWTWGKNTNGELGTNDATSRSTPVTTFAGGNNWKQVDCNNGFTAAIKTDGSLWTWGRNLGFMLGINGGFVLKSTPITTFAGGNNWKQVACGADHTAAIKTDGSLWVWGYNSSGNLGTNNTTNMATPVTTFVGGTNWKQVSSGSNHTAAIKTDGSLWTWGSGGNGRLGNFATTNRSTPVTTFAGGNTWKSVDCGGDHIFAIKTDGTLWGWGRNSGTLGNNRSDPTISTPITTFAGGTNWKSIACGYRFNAAIKTDGSLWTWGEGFGGGMLGVNDSFSREVPVTTFAGGTTWKSSAAGQNHTAAIRTNETTTTDVSISTPLLNTTYYNIVATSNGTTLKLYQNNSLLTTANLNGTLTSTTLFYTISDIMNSFAGNLSNIQVYNKELSTTEIQQNYISIKTRFGL
jgi:alpha-tubulin suppressor-like RCC1 family protein